MECQCGNPIEIKMASRISTDGCKVLTSLTTIATVECLNCGKKFQVPVSSSEYIMKEN